MHAICSSSLQPLHIIDVISIMQYGYSTTIYSTRTQRMKSQLVAASMPSNSNKTPCCYFWDVLSCSCGWRRASAASTGAPASWCCLTTCSTLRVSTKAGQAFEQPVTTLQPPPRFCGHLGFVQDLSLQEYCSVCSTVRTLSSVNFGCRLLSTAVDNHK
jgi:hypothetical protein